MTKPAKAAAAPVVEDEQAKLLEDSKKVVTQQAFYMKRCLDGGKLMDALKHASNFLSELRTSLLSPQAYYELYIQVFDQLRHLESYLYEERTRGRKMGELYELVQYAGNIVPRLYLLITVGSVYIRSREAPARDVLRDLLEMCRGVQHPTRGLFVRNYLSEMTKDKLPDRGSEYEGDGGSTADSVEFILGNFTEMNKLWVRMALQGPAKERERRAAEREELRQLVGKNLARLSQLDGLDAAAYAANVLPAVLEQVVNCKEPVAQQYLMEGLIQAFPDDFHIPTLAELLAACAQLQPAVDLKQIVVSLIERLATFAAKAAQHAGQTGLDVGVLETFASGIAKAIEARPAMPLDEQLAMQTALLNLALKAFKQRLELVDAILRHTHQLVSARLDQQQAQTAGQPVIKSLLRMLAVPIDTYKNVLVLLKLPHYLLLMQSLHLPLRKRVALDLVRSMVDNATLVPDSATLAPLLEWIAPIIRDDPPAASATAAAAAAKEPAASDAAGLPLGGAPAQSARPGAAVPAAASSDDDDELHEQQTMLARVVHLLDPNSANVEDLFQMYNLARRYFGAGGVKRLRFTLPPLVFRSLMLAHRLKAMVGAGAMTAEAWGSVGRKVFKFANDTVTALARYNEAGPELNLGLFLACAQAADACGFDAIAYEFFTQVFVIYENDLADSRQQAHALSLITGALLTFQKFGDEQLDALRLKCVQHAAKLLKKLDQTRAVYTAAHLFWRFGRDSKRVLEFLQRALKIADSCMDNVHLFVEILNQYVYHLEQKNDAVQLADVAKLIELVRTNLAQLEQPNAPENIAIKAHFENTLRHLRKKKEEDRAFAALQL